MRSMFLMALMLSCFIVPVFGSENELEVVKKIVFTVKLKNEESPRLKCLAKNKINKLKQFLSDNTICDKETFFAVTVNKNNNMQQVKCYTHDGYPLDEDKLTQIHNDLKNNLQYLPVKYFVSEKENALKPHGAELCSYIKTRSFSEKYLPNVLTPYTYDIVINSDSHIADKFNLADLLLAFRKNPDYAPEDEEELIASGILAKNENGKIIHGPNSIIGEERKAAQEIKEKLALFYSRLRNFFIGGFALIFMYVLYKKFYTTS